MHTERRTFLRKIMDTAWYAFRNRHIPGSNVHTFGDAMRNAWAWLRRTPAAPMTQHLRFGTMVASPIRRSLGGKAYAYTNARWAGRTTTAMGL
jgi:hypothetical protein